jgi:TRAP-type C4-dicarboxylate transport system substrate-binding protein
MSGNIRRSDLARRATFVAFASAFVAMVVGPVSAQDVTLKLHQMLPPQAQLPAHFLTPWIEKVEAESGGRIKIDHYPAMQLGGKPPTLFDQARDGVVDITWTVAGYTPGRFPKSEVFELPFMPASAEATSRAAWEFYERHLTDEFADVHVLAIHVHGPGLLHVKGEGVRALEDMRGKKLRGPTRMINRLLDTLGATPVGMPVPAVPEALSRGVIDGTVIPWEITRPLHISELVGTHTNFTSNRGLYTAIFVFSMNKESYGDLSPDLRAVIDENSGIETSAWAGRVMQEGDAPARQIAIDSGNAIVVLDEAETARWQTAAKPVTDQWIAEMNDLGVDGAALYQEARSLIDKYAAD